MNPKPYHLFDSLSRTRRGLAGIRGSQADRIINIFGGARRLARLLNSIGYPINPSSVFRWTYPASKRGTDGLIPTRVWPHIIKAARYEGVLLSPDLFDPRVNLQSINEDEAISLDIFA